MRNGVKWSLRDTDKMGETSGAGKLSCLKQGWRNFSVIEVALLQHKKGCGALYR